ALLRAAIAPITSLRSSRCCGCVLCSDINSATPAVVPSTTARRKSRFFLGEILKVLQISSKSKLEIHLGIGEILGWAANVLPLLKWNEARLLWYTPYRGRYAMCNAPASSRIGATAAFAFPSNADAMRAETRSAAATRALSGTCA